MKAPSEQIIKSIISRLHGVIDETKVREIYEASDIKVSDDAAPVINGNPDVVLDKLLRILIKEGNYLVKITLHNLAQENDLQICPLCKEVNNEEDKTESGREDEPDKDVAVKILHSTPSKKIILINLKNGAVLNDHAVDCPITVLCVSGKGTFETGDKSEILIEGSVIKLAAGVVHNVKSDNEVELLVTKFMAA